VRIIRVFPRRTNATPTDDLAFVGDPPLWHPPADRVDVSVTFTWDLAEGHRLREAWAEHYSAVWIGGPAFGDPGDTFEPGMYVKRGITFTSRGCPRHCPWCLVPERSGPLRLLDPIPEGYIVNDDNFLACSPDHRQAVYAMLRRQPRAAVFAGGIDCRLVTDGITDEFRTIRISEMFLAADTRAAVAPLRLAAERLDWLGWEKLRCFVMVGYGSETISQATERLEAIWQVGIMPFCQLYQPPSDHRLEYSPEWRRLQRTWSRPAAMKAMHRVEVST